MKKYRFSILTILLIGLSIISKGQNLNPADFQKKMKGLLNAPIIDVRTSGEFSQSHLKNAVNISINGDNFVTQISKYDKSKPIFVYCLSGSRSAYAQNLMQSQGFKEVYNLSGGLIKWRAAGLPESTDNANNSAEMSSSQFNELLKSDKLVLVDIYADWCAPCKKMAPSLEEIKTEMASKINLVRINADQNKSIVQELKVTALPTLLLYKNKKLIWSNVGFLTKEDIISHLK